MTFRHRTRIDHALYKGRHGFLLTILEGRGRHNAKVFVLTREDAEKARDNYRAGRDICAGLWGDVTP